MILIAVTHSGNGSIYSGFPIYTKDEFILALKENTHRKIQQIYYCQIRISIDNENEVSPKNLSLSEFEDIFTQDDIDVMKNTDVWQKFRVAVQRKYS